MLLKLKYFLKTNSTVRAIDEMEYLDMCEKLNPLRVECEKCLEKITGYKVYPYTTFNPGGFIYCLDKYGHKCYWLNKEHKCMFLGDCLRYPANQKYIRARDAYLSQQKIVDEFWTKRMTERINTK